MYFKRLAYSLMGMPLLFALTAAPPVSAQTLSPSGAGTWLQAPLGESDIHSDGSQYEDASYTEALHYAVDLKIDPVTKVLSGKAKITVRTLLPATNLKFQFKKQFEVSSALVDGKSVRSIEHSESNDLVLHLSGQVEAGSSFEVEITYSGPMVIDMDTDTESGWLKNEAGELLTAFDSDTLIFPSTLNASGRATSLITLTTPAGWKGVSVGKLQEETTLPDGSNQLTWNATKELSPRSNFVAVGKFDIERSVLPDGMEMVNAFGEGTLPSARKAVEKISETRDFLEDLFGSYPYDWIGGVFMEFGDGPAVEKAGRSLFLSLKDTFTPSVMAHEMAHTYWGDLVTGIGENGFCMSECLASYAQWRWDDRNGEASASDTYRKWVASADADPEKWNGLGGWNAYSKGPAAFYALSQFMGRDKLDEALRNFIRENRHNTTAPTPWSVLEAAIQAATEKDLSEFFQEWFHSGTRPRSEFVDFPAV
ncbi:M1 family aminopeptidase [Lysinibacter sp. HNR]|uniref:M1 family aminopeptidase n=1 Tax=Lysinibacter sp. HNR TaxID=3031408 RepID=UPI00243497B7|nr:M1 family aminopeptidase [Lysinibacter sp. HNR]WGD37639.1 M1 family aminopeptidase [Lysinibacter sp. HNR]